ncbi:TPA: hypothetical protein ACQQY3_006634, partial [Pseudomonas aeruginosa]
GYGYCKKAFISLSPVKSGYNWVSGETFGHGNSALVETLETLRSGQLLPGKSFTAISPACHPDVFFPVWMPVDSNWRRFAPCESTNG